ncbi:LOB domain-containing protein 16 [Phtheirospermum japonicum]|uniref:LOB domain-containing protein 16 n=1 Tax=Phtheirospermum japonicum TaxID=374723 RepID=A0A830CX43_9LAMI|nr:LOB domain-containing protein 16 [Phtheirospermum japonicum]
MATGTGSPCGACKFLRRKCAADCVFAPYFCSEQGPARFAAIHKVFGASNVSKLLLHVPVPDRCEAVVTIAYEAQARIRDPVYGCVAHIFALQQQVAYLQAQLMQVKSQLAQSLMIDQSSRNAENHQWSSPGTIAPGFMGSPSPIFPFPNYYNNNNYMNHSNISPQSSLDSINEHHNDHGINNGMQEIQSRDEYPSATCPNHSKKRPSQTDMSELQALALRMMKDEN